MERIYLNNGWYYTDDFKEEMLKLSFNYTDLEQVRLPHTNHMYGGNYTNTNDYQKQCLYIRTISYEPKSTEDKYLLTIEAAAHYAKLYVNGNFICDHKCGYTSFKADITSYLKKGNENIVAIFVDSNETLNQPPFGATIDYATFGGIYREVYLDIKSSNYITDLFFETDDLQQSKKKLLTQIEVAAYEEGLSIHQLIRGPLSQKEDSNQKCSNLAFEKDMDQQILTSNGHKQSRLIESDIQLWSLDHPVLYEITTKLLKNGTVIDERIDKIGFREIRWDRTGFYLNGEKIKIRGLNRHQSYPYVGYAMPKSQQRKDAEVLKYELGVNTVRTSHYPQSKYFIERCDEIGLLVFTEIPGWQHIGNEEWQKIACENVKEMVVQYRNHPSIILWGVRINESQDLDSFYEKTNQIAHHLDTTRPTGGVRYIKNSHLLEDVYTYNDFSHDGIANGVDKKKNVTKEDVPYLVTEYNGHMYPTKPFDDEEHMKEHALRHARVMNGYYQEDGIAGGIGWCMFDYQTHSDFGSGDCICYHGVLDMFRNPKLAAYVYQSQQEDIPVLEISSTMDMGEHPGSSLGTVYAFTNADCIKLYKNDEYITTCYPNSKQSKHKKDNFTHLTHPPILINDMIGEQLEKEGYTKQVSEDLKTLIMIFSQYGQKGITFRYKLLALKLMLFHHLKMQDAVQLYGKYIGNWGKKRVAYRFEAIKDGKVVKTIEKGAISSKQLFVEADHTELREDTTYDVAAIRIQMIGDNHQLLRYEQSAVQLKVTGEIELIGPDCITLPGGMSGTYIKTTGKTGNGELTVTTEGAKPVSIHFTIDKKDCRL